MSWTITKKYSIIFLNMHFAFVADANGLLLLGYTYLACILFFPINLYEYKH
jgi:hypothetical protein